MKKYKYLKILQNIQEVAPSDQLPVTLTAYRFCRVSGAVAVDAAAGW